VSGCASLRELTLSMLSDAERMPHIGICFKLSRSTLADANRRRSEKVFGSIYMSLYEKYRGFLSDSSEKIYYMQKSSANPELTGQF